MDTRNNKTPSFEQLPWEFIKKVINEIPLKSLFNFSLVNKDLYSIICLNDRFKHSVFIKKDQVSVLMNKIQIKSQPKSI